MVKLIHYSDQPLTQIRSAAQNSEPELHGKPNGLWVSVGNAWSDWCRNNNFSLGELAHEVHLADDPNILWITKASELDAFNSRFGEPSTWFKSIHVLRWAQVAEQYDGIIISPYIWSRRLELSCHWYYGWDCACGCIWNARAISTIGEPVQHDGVQAQ